MHMSYGEWAWTGDCSGTGAYRGFINVGRKSGHNALLVVISAYRVGR